MNSVRILSSAVALAAVLLQLGHHLGISLVDCSSGCSVIRDWPGSLALEFAALVLSSAMLAAAFRQRTDTCSALGWIALAGVGISVVAMRLLEAYCPMCGLADVALVTFFFASRDSKAGNLLALVAGVVGFSFAGWMAFEVQSRVSTARFAIRSYEKAPEVKRNPVLLFSDPECPHCKVLMAKLDQSGDLLDGKVYFRWMLRPASSDRTLWAAVAIETVFRSEPGLGKRYRSALYGSEGQLTKQRIIELAPSGSSRALVEEALKRPNETVLAWIKEDGDLAASLRVATVPAYCGIVAGEDGQDIMLTRLPEDTFLSLTVDAPGGSRLGEGGDH